MRFPRPGSLLVVLALLVYALLATWNIETPGIQYDEVLFGNASLGIQDHSFIAWAWPLGVKNVPVMLMPYIGALKAYLYYPVVRILGADPLALRLPAILIGGAALLLYFVIARRIIGLGGAVVFALFLATDPSYLYHVRLDWGPVALMLLLKAAGAYFFLRWWDTKSRWSLALSGFSLGLGLYDKANFVWFLIAAALTAALVYRRELLARVTAGAIAVFVIPLVLGSSPLILYNVAFPLATFREPFEVSGGLLAGASGRRLSAIVETLLGVAVFRFVNFDDVQTLWASYVPPTPMDGASGLPSLLTKTLTFSPFGQGTLLLVALLLSVAYLAYRLASNPHPLARPTVAVGLASLFIVLQLLVTRGATGSYHVLMLYPLPHLLVSMALVNASERLGITNPFHGRRFSLRRSAVHLVVAVLVVSNLLVDVGYLRYFSAEGGRGLWSTAIYDLVDFARERPANRLVLMDWGFNTQLLILSKGSIRKDEVFHWLTDGQTERERFDTYLRDPESLYLFHAPPYTRFPQPKQLFGRLLRERGLGEEVVRTFYQRNGEAVFYLSRVVVDRS